jgi:methenyltetrahydromethanopterin cyclohydrolase
MDYDDLQLNDSAMEIVDELAEGAEDANVLVHTVDEATVIDCGIETTGGLLAARYVAEACCSGAATIGIVPDRLEGVPCPRIAVEMDEPTIPCLLSQYAGWKVTHKKFFAMTSGPIRAVLAEEPIFKKFDYDERDSEFAVAVMETRDLPLSDIVAKVRKAVKVSAENLAILVAPTSSIVGCLQVVARSVETCLHKLFELGFDVRSIRAATGSAFMPPVPKDDLLAIGRTNDSILYSAEVNLWVDCEDDAVQAVAAKLPASASPDFGTPFAELFKRSGGDFYKLDPMLFSPAMVVVNNLRSGSVLVVGRTDHALLAKSFYGR